MQTIYIVLFVSILIAILFLGVSFFFISNETARKVLGGFLVALTSILLLSVVCWFLLRFNRPQSFDTKKRSENMITGGDGTQFVDGDHSQEPPRRRRQIQSIRFQEPKVRLDLRDGEAAARTHPDAYWHRDDVKPIEKYSTMTKDVPQRFDALYSLFASSDKSYGLKDKYDFEDHPFAVLAVSKDDKKHHVFMMRCQSFSPIGKTVLENHSPLGSGVDELIKFTKEIKQWSAIIPIGINDFSNAHQTLMIIEKNKDDVKINILDPMGDAVLGDSASKIFDYFRQFFPSAEFKYLSCGVQVSNVYCVLYSMKFAYHYLDEGANLSSSSTKICPGYSKKHLEENDRFGDLNLTSFEG